MLQDRIRGSMIGGAVGDALGYAVEFSYEDEIFGKYGPSGITEYELVDGKARISDDTQMTLFTACGLLNGYTRLVSKGTGAPLRRYICDAYCDWYDTQFKSYENYQRHNMGRRTWLMEVPELFARRAPGNTCLSGLLVRKEGAVTNDYIASPINTSKGCGGIMRIAPIALLLHRPDGTDGYSREELDREAAQAAAITHSHSLGYIPAAIAAHIISRAVTSADTMSLREMVVEARDTAARLFADDPNLYQLLRLLDGAIALSEFDDDDDLRNIHALGQGWVAEETLAIAVYCALKYQNDFSKAIITAVNHKGDSDSTGAVTGNILGAFIGYEAIDAKWKKDLELADVILELADDLYRAPLMDAAGMDTDTAWVSRYVECRRYQSTK